MNQEFILDHIENMESCLQWMPKNERMRAKLTTLFTAMVGTQDIQSLGRLWSPEDRVTWISEAIVDELGEWPKRGLAEIRGLYCLYWRPADGIEGHCELENPPRPARLPVDDGVPRIGASPVDAEFVAIQDSVRALAERKRVS